MNTNHEPRPRQMPTNHDHELRTKILISLWPGLGDVIFATPVFRTLRKKFPDAHITALIWSTVARELLNTNPYIDELVEGSFLKIRSLASKFKNYDIGIQCSHPVQFLFILAGIKKRVSFNGNPLWWLYPAGSNNFHSTEYFLRTVDKIDGVKFRDGNYWEIFLEKKELAPAQSILKDFRNPDSPLVAIHPGARNNKCKRWEVHKFAHLCNFLIDKFNVKIVLIGGKKDIELCNFIENHMPLCHSELVSESQYNSTSNFLNLAGKLSLRESAAIIKLCDLFVGNASGPTYIASALGTPVVAIFGPDNPRNFGPIGEPLGEPLGESLGKNVQVVTPKLKCAPCLHFYRHFLRGLRLRYIPFCKAMQSIQTDEVFNACSHFLK